VIPPVLRSVADVVCESLGHGLLGPEAVAVAAKMPGVRRAVEIRPIIKV
jgi:hypothetical protein